MPAVFVHGVPETARIWGPLVERLERTDVVTVELPGFGVDRPGGFDATKESYVDWLIAELERIGADGPVDLVGHDWGAGFVVRLVSLRQDLVRSWATDSIGFARADFEWHDFAKIWQTPGEGEAFWAENLAQSVEERAALFEAFGVPAEGARIIGSGIDQRMADCILSLYRSAMTVGQEWSPDFRDIAKPGLVISASDDPFGNPVAAKEDAAAIGARLAELGGVGHWWMLQDPAAGAATLDQFWAGL